MATVRQTASAESFFFPAADPAVAVRAVLELLARRPPPTGLLLFACGRIAARLDDTAAALRAGLHAKTTAILVPSAGVLTERGEAEGADALAGMAWHGGSAESVWVEDDSGGTNPAVDTSFTSLAEAVAARMAPDEPGTLVLFVRPAGFAAGMLDAIGQSRAKLTIVGAGTLDDAPGKSRAGGGAIVLSPGAPAEGVPLAGILLRGAGARPAVRVADACRPLHPALTITQTRGSMVLRLDDQPALDVLSTHARHLEGRPLVLALVARPSENDDDDVMVVRPIRGVDPVRRGVVIGSEAVVGAKLCFAVRDPTTARRKIETAVRHLSRELAGGAPRFGLVFDCAGRGNGLYGTPDVDTRIVAGAFPAVPFAGMFSTFEIGPRGPSATELWYSAVVSVFSSPS